MQLIQEKDQSYYLENGDKKAYILHPEKNGVLTIKTVFVNEELRGQGLASKTMHDLYDYCKRNNLKVIALCPYAVMWFKRNKDKRDILVEE